MTKWKKDDRQIDIFAFDEYDLEEEEKKAKERIKKEKRKIPHSLKCPECDRSLKLRKVDKKDRSNTREAWVCNICGMQSCNEYGDR